jgi:NADPH-dependent 2,4-dienoyl-CoA reductase/sulfur reductase-like enzyme
MVARFHPDLIVNATGSRPLLPPIEGLAESLREPNPNVFTIKGVIKEVCDSDLTGKKIAIAGGGAAGIDAIEFFAKRGAHVTIVEQKEEIGYGIDPITRCSLNDNLKKYPVTLYPNTTLKKIRSHAFEVERQGERETIPFDYAYICLGMLSDAPLLEDLCRTFRQSGVEVLNIGDSRGARRMIDGVREGRNLLTTLEHLSYFG